MESDVHTKEMLAFNISHRNAKRTLNKPKYVKKTHVLVFKNLADSSKISFFCL